MTTHQATEPSLVADYFGSLSETGRQHALISQTFTQGKGWKDYPIRKRVSTSWLRRLRSEGVTHVALISRGRRADFSVEELLRGPRR
jgi:hypothetical protein